MKIVFLNPIAKVGGAERVLLDLISGLRKARPDWALSLVAGGEGPLVERVRRLGAAAEVLPLPASLARLGDWTESPPGLARSAGLSLSLLRAAPAAWSYAARLRSVLSAAGPDLVHSNGPKMHLLAARATPEDCGLVWHIHDYVGTRPALSRLLAAAARPEIGVVANSESVAEDFRTACPRATRVRAVLNSVDLETFSPTGPAADLEALSGLPPAPRGAVRVGLAATFARWKGHAVFLQAMAAVAKTHSVRGYVIGGPIYEGADNQLEPAALRSIATRLGLQETVGFTGYVDRPAEALRALDVAVHASTAPEPFGLAVAEAMACGRALVVSLGGGVSEIVSVGEDALAHRPGDAAGLAEAIGRLAADGDLRARLGAAGRRAAELRFDPAKFVAEMISEYEAVLGTRPAGGVPGSAAAP